MHHLLHDPHRGRPLPGRGRPCQGTPAHVALASRRTERAPTHSGLTQAGRCRSPPPHIAVGVRARAQTLLVYRVSNRGATLSQALSGRDAVVRAVTLIEADQATYAVAALSTGYLSLCPVDTT